MGSCRIEQVVRSEPSISTIKDSEITTDPFQSLDIAAFLCTVVRLF